MRAQAVGKIGIEAAQGAKRNRAQLQCQDVIGPQCHAGIEIVKRLLPARLPVQQRGGLAGSVEIAGVEPERLPVAQQRLVIAPKLNQHVAEVAPQLRAVGL